MLEIERKVDNLFRHETGTEFVRKHSGEWAMADIRFTHALDRSGPAAPVSCSTLEMGFGVFTQPRPDPDVIESECDVRFTERDGLVWKFLYGPFDLSDTKKERYGPLVKGLSN